MSAFKDNQDREWEIAITVDAVRRVDKALGVNLARIVLPRSGADQPLLTELQIDISLLVDVLYVLVQAQAREREIDDEEFGRSLDGAAFQAAHTAFWRELESFFQSLPHRQAEVKAIQKSREMLDAAANMAVERMELEAAKAMNILSRSILGDSAGSSPESSGSTPDPTPSAS